MNRYPLVLLFVVVAACSSSSVRDYYRADTVFTSAVEVLTALRVAGEVSDDQYRTITPVIHAADKALDEWHAALKAPPPGEKPSVAPIIINTVRDQLDEILMWIVRLKGRK